MLRGDHSKIKSNQIKSFILSLNSQFTIMICTCQHKIKNKLPEKGFQKSIAYLAGLHSIAYLAGFPILQNEHTLSGCTAITYFIFC